jgi:hypothetical protein
MMDNVQKHNICTLNTSLAVGNLNVLPSILKNLGRFEAFPDQQNIESLYS